MTAVYSYLSTNFIYNRVDCLNWLKLEGFILLSLDPADVPLGGGWNLSFLSVCFSIVFPNFFSRQD